MTEKRKETISEQERIAKGVRFRRYVTFVKESFPFSKHLLSHLGCLLGLGLGKSRKNGVEIASCWGGLDVAVEEGIYHFPKQLGGLFHHVKVGAFVRRVDVHVDQIRVAYIVGHEIILSLFVAYQHLPEESDSTLDGILAAAIRPTMKDARIGKKIRLAIGVDARIMEAVHFPKNLFASFRRVGFVVCDLLPRVHTTRVATLVGKSILVSAFVILPHKLQNVFGSFGISLDGVRVQHHIVATSVRSLIVDTGVKGDNHLTKMSFRTSGVLAIRFTTNERFIIRPFRVRNLRRLVELGQLGKTL